jgi:hypothetical protein
MQEFSPTARYLCLDTATKNMGFVVRQLGTDKYWHPKQLSITCTAQGYVYHELEESTIPEMTLRFLTDHKSIIEKLDFIVFEKAVHDKVIRDDNQEYNRLTKNKTISNTVITEISIRSHLMSLPWAPPFVVKPASWWRNATGVKAENTDNLTTKEKYKQDKQTSIDAFIERFGREHYTHLIDGTPERQAEDIIEAYWLGEAVQLRWDEIQIDLRKVNNYDATLYPSVKARIPAECRQGSWKNLSGTEVAPTKEVLTRYHEYMKDRRKKSVAAKSKKVLNNVGVKRKKDTETALKVYKKFKELR